MASRRKPDNGWLWGLGIAAIGGLTLLALAGGSEKNSPVLRDDVENAVDKVVDFLNKNVGKGWLGAAVTALRAALPVPLRPFLAVVHAAEALGSQSGWSGLQKKAHAVNQYMQGATA